MYKIQCEQMQKDALHHHQATVPNDCADYSVPAGLARYKEPTSVISLLRTLNVTFLCVCACVRTHTHTGELEDDAPEGEAAAHRTSQPCLWGRVSLVVDRNAVGLICYKPRDGEAEYLNFSQGDAGDVWLMATDEVTFEVVDGGLGNRRRAVCIKCPRRIGHVLAWCGHWGILELQVSPQTVENLRFTEEDAAFATYFRKGDKVTFEVQEDTDGRHVATKVIGGRSFTLRGVKASFATGVLPRERGMLTEFIRLHQGQIAEDAYDSSNCIVGGLQTEEINGQLSSAQVFAEIQHRCAAFKKLHPRKRTLRTDRYSCTPARFLRQQMRCTVQATSPAEVGVAAVALHSADGTTLSAASGPPRFVRHRASAKLTSSQSTDISHDLADFAGAGLVASAPA